MSETPSTTSASTQVAASFLPLPVEIGGGVLVVVAAAVALLRRRPPPAALPPTAPTPASPTAAPPSVPVAPPVAPTPAVETANRAELEAAVQEKAARSAAKQAENDAAKAASAAPEALAKLQAEWKDLEEERKKAEYRLRRATEAEEKERRRAAQELQAAAEATERARLESEKAAREAADVEAQRQKVQAVAGRTLAEGLDKTRHGFMARLGQLFGGSQPIDDKILAELEEVLFSADIGVRTAQRLIELAREKVRSRELSDGAKLKAALRSEIESILALDHAGEAVKLAAKPTVIMVVGVNGAGKTTTIGKLAAQFQRENQGVVLAAGDTYRAAATEQLAIWAERAGVPMVRGAEGSDPGAVAFDGVKKAQASGASVVLCDTAGRLHTNVQLMEELRKVKRVLEKAQPGAPHEVLLVLDSTNGQNAIVQARQFHEALGVTGIALTKLDGTAKGGVIIGICDELKLPVRYVGIGESIEDLRSFQPREFVAALFQ